jgi:hypothetical protein
MTSEWQYWKSLFQVIWIYKMPWRSTLDLIKFELEIFKLRKKYFKKYRSTKNEKSNCRI